MMIALALSSQSLTTVVLVALLPTPWFCWSVIGLVRNIDILQRQCLNATMMSMIDSRRNDRSIIAGHLGFDAAGPTCQLATVQQYPLVATNDDTFLTAWADGRNYSDYTHFEMLTLASELSSDSRHGNCNHIYKEFNVFKVS
jgi:hypothetical protein